MIRHLSSVLTTWLTKRRSTDLRTLEIAEELGVTEGELVASACGASGELVATRLRGAPVELLGELSVLGPMKAITRNRDAVLEVDGAYAELELFEHTGRVAGEIDLRLSPGRWRHVFSLREESKRGPRVSLQFFDDAGAALHEAHATAETDHEALEELIERRTAANQSPTMPVERPPSPPPTRPDDAIDVAGLRAAWRAMKDTHELLDLLRRFEVGRHQALRLLGPDFARPASPKALEKTLADVAAASVPIMIFVGNPGLIQIWSGPVRRLVPRDGWVHVLDPTLDLRVREDRIDNAWVVRKPTDTGVVTALEVYSGEELTTLIVGKRRPGDAENEAWRRIVVDAPAPEVTR